MERRAAIVRTYFLLGSWIRETEDHDEKILIIFLDKYAASMPRITFRNAIERLKNNKAR